MSGDLDRARELLRMGRPKEAAAAAMRQLAETPESADAHLMLALSQMQLGAHASAIGSAEVAVRLQPDEAHAHYVIALVSVAAGQPRRARVSVQRALELDPDKASAHDLMARLLLADGERQASLAAAEAAIELDPEDADHHATRARALRALGRHDEAAHSVASGLRLAPEDPELIALQAELHLSRGETEQAEDTFLSALRKNPDDEAARRGLLEALRARHPGYRWVLKLRQGVLQLARERHWIVLFLCFAGCALLAGLIAGRNGVQALRAGLIAVLLVPKELANLLLLLHPFGRRVLRRHEIGFGAATGALLLAAAGSGAAAWLTDVPALRDAAMGCGGATLFTAMLHFAIEHSRIRRTTWVLIAVMIVLWIVVIVVMWLWKS